MNFVTKKQKAIVSFSSSDLEASNHKLAKDLSGMILDGLTEVELRAPTALDVAWEPFTSIFQFAAGAEKAGLKVNWNFPDTLLSNLAQSGLEIRSDHGN